MPNQNILIIQSSWGIGFKCKGDLRNVWNAPFFCFIFNQMNVAYQILVQMLSRRLLILVIRIKRISIRLYLHNIMRSKANKNYRVHKIAFNSVTNVILQNKVMSC